MKAIENVIDREVVIVEVASSELGDSWTLAEKVGDCFLLMPTEEAFFSVRFIHVAYSGPSVRLRPRIILVCL